MAKKTKPVMQITDKDQEFTIAEWDGEINKVNAKKENDYVVITYENGLQHEVTEEYFNSLIIK